MNFLVAPMLSKWQAVTTAVKTFLNDPKSAGLGIGVQYFPKTAPGVPASCTSSAQCGAAGPCLLNFCDGVPQVIACNTYMDCPVFCTAPRRCFYYNCVPAGVCANNHSFYCAPGTPCSPDPNGFALGACQALTSSSCVAGEDCASADYAAPAVPIAALPGAAVAINASLGMHQPQGETPTQSALTGVIGGAKAYAAAHPGDTVVVVLATDGQPNEIAGPGNQCTAPASPQAANTQVAQVAAAALAGTPSIKTFGIGVFTPDDITSGTATLDQLAMAGGTGQPFIIGTANNNNVEQQFLAALTAIRGASLPCNYAVPTPQAGTPDYFKINVSYTSGAGTTTTIPYVESAGACDPTQGGWYYNSDPAEGGTPSSINVCPNSCTTLKGDAGGRVDIVLGCQTQRILIR
jgi:hypothetical protein